MALHWSIERVEDWQQLAQDDEQQNIWFRVPGHQAYDVQLTSEGHHDVLEAVRRQIAREQRKHIGDIGCSRSRGRQADIVLVFSRGQDHSGGCVDQAAEQEAVNVRNGVEYRFGLIQGQ